jgi:hypothetical protein
MPRYGELFLQGVYRVVPGLSPLLVEELSAARRGSRHNYKVVPHVGYKPL